MGASEKAAATYHGTCGEAVAPGGVACGRDAGHDGDHRSLNGDVSWPPGFTWPRPLQVGDVIATAEEVAALPVGTVLYGNDRAWEKWVLDGVPGWSARGWWFLRADDRTLHDQLLLSHVVRHAIVMYVPGVTP